MRKLIDFLPLIIAVFLVSVSSSWQTVGAKVRLMATPKSSDNVHKLKPPGSVSDEAYDYGCNWECAYHAPKAFSISSSSQVFFTSGNLIRESEQWYARDPMPGGNWGALLPHTRTAWYISSHQWESIFNLSDIYYLQRDDEGSIATPTVGIFNQPVNINTMKEFHRYEDMFSFSSSYFQFECEDDWAEIMPEDDPRRYFVLQDIHWNYLMNRRANASSLRQVGKLNCLLNKSESISESGLFIYPDEYDGPKVGSTPVDSVTWFKMEKAGAIFLPTTGKKDGVECGYYWASTLGGSNKAFYFDMNGKVDVVTMADEDAECAVRHAYYYKQGRGTAASPFKISSGKDMAAFCHEVNTDFPDMQAELVADISLADYPDWEPVGYYFNAKKSHPFAGKFNGNGHTISGLTQTTLRGDGGFNVYSGLFGYVVDGAEIYDFTLKGNIVIADETNVFVYGASSVIGIINLTSNKGVLVHDICNQASYTLNSSKVGIVCAGGIVSRCMGETISDASLQISKCWCISGGLYLNTPNVSKAIAGGILGAGPDAGILSISACGSYGTLSVNNSEDGCAILGYQDCTSDKLTLSITDCYSHCGGKYALAELETVVNANISISNNYYRQSVYGGDNVVMSTYTLPDNLAVGQTDEEIESGKTTYLLNHKVSGAEPWHQKIADGYFPVLTKTSPLVYSTDDPDVFTNDNPLATSIRQPFYGNDNGVAEYYDLSGRRVNDISNLHGCYIKVVNGKSKKIFL